MNKIVVTTPPSGSVGFTKPLLKSGLSESNSLTEGAKQLPLVIDKIKNS